MRFVSLEELFQSADIIALSTPALGQPIINADSIATMKDGVVIINTSRGSNIDEAALLEALNSGKVRAAGLDVWAEEPTKNVELSQHPAVSALPHIGASTGEAQKRIGSEIVSIIENF
jgi:D-3-phosphoglycerate dehydrogenase